MRILSAPFGAAALALGLFVTNPLPAFGQCCGNHSCRAGGVNIPPSGNSSVFLASQTASYNAVRIPVMPFYPQIPGYLPTANSSGSQATTSSSSLATSPAKSSFGNTPSTSWGNAEKDDANQAPVEPAVHLRYVELSVSGMESAADKDRLTAALDTMKGSRGATVKGKPGTTVTVKVWYSDKEPIEADLVLQGVTKLGFTGKVVGS